MDSAAADSGPVIEVAGVDFGYGGDLVLRDVSLSIAGGDFLAIIGPNGSGKSTLLKIILGILKPAKGEVRIMGRRLQEFDDWSLIGYVPQKATSFDPLFPASAAEVVAMALRAVPRKGREERRKVAGAVRAALESVGMGEFAGRRIGRLSGGQQQRVFIARAIVRQPRILFLDEPTTGVDAATQDRFYEMLGRLNAERRLTIVLVTHDTGIVDQHVSSVACLNQSLVYHGDHREFCDAEALAGAARGHHHLVLHRH